MTSDPLQVALHLSPHEQGACSCKRNKKVIIIIIDYVLSFYHTYSALRKDGNTSCMDVRRQSKHVLWRKILC